MDKSIFSKLAAIPILIVLLGAGILAARIAIDWTPEETKYLMGGLLTILGAALGVFALAFGLLAGVGIYRRLQADAAHSYRPAARDSRWQVLPPGPPQLTAGDSQGSWYSQGPASYDVWEEDEAAEDRWQAIG